MARVGILTYHYVLNEGAIWQACSLCEHLRRLLPEHRVEIADVRYRAKYESLASGRSEAVRSAYEAVLKPYLSDFSLVTDSAADILSALEARYDAVVVGSDIVWSIPSATPWMVRLVEAVRKRGALRPSCASPYAFLRDVKNWTRLTLRDCLATDPRRIPFPNAYWLAPELKTRKFSFAASCGYTRMQQLPATVLAEVGRRAAAFDVITVRDPQTADLLRLADPALAGRVRLCPDPAWLFNGELPDGQALLRRAGVPEGRRLAGVLCPPAGWWGASLNGWVLPVLRECGFHTVSVIDANRGADTNLAASALTPLEWWAVVRELDFLFTVRTHPTIAALKVETAFFNVDITAMQHRVAHSKSREMLASFGLQDCCLVRRQDFSRASVQAGLREALHRTWDWNAIRAAVAEQRGRAGRVAVEIAEAIRVA